MAGLERWLADSYTPGSSHRKNVLSAVIDADQIDDALAEIQNLHPSARNDYRPVPFEDPQPIQLEANNEDDGATTAHDATSLRASLAEIQTSTGLQVSDYVAEYARAMEAEVVEHNEAGENNIATNLFPTNSSIIANGRISDRSSPPDASEQALDSSEQIHGPVILDINEDNYQRKLSARCRPRKK